MLDNFTKGEVKYQPKRFQKGITVISKRSVSKEVQTEELSCGFIGCERKMNIETILLVVYRTSNGL